MEGGTSLVSGTINLMISVSLSIPISSAFSSSCLGSSSIYPLFNSPPEG